VIIKTASFDRKAGLNPIPEREFMKTAWQHDVAQPPLIA
jgi:hypothetical protein